MANKSHILVVDDDDAILQLLYNTIKREGFDCSRAPNGDHALAILAKNNVDVVITDITMPGLSGIELNKIVNDQYDSDVIVMSGNVDAFAYEQVMAHDATDYIQKPFTSKELLLRLNRVLKERAITSELKRVDKELTLSVEKHKKTIRDTLKAMTLAVEKRDPYASGHQNRVADLAHAIAKEMGLSKKQMELIYIAGGIHDLGKIAVPAQILRFPGKLNEHEFGIIKNHPSLTYTILKSIELPWSIAPIAHQHHEKLNGSGYPLGLHEKEILLESKVLCVADCAEAMISDRPYRKALTIETALNEIVEHKHTWFDPLVVDACVTILTKGKFPVYENG